MGGANSRPGFEERINTLVEGNPPKSPEFWVSLWANTVTRTDILEVMPIDRIRKMRRERPRNFALLLAQVAEQLHNKIGGEAALYQALMILSTVAPVAIEPDEESGELFVSTYLWPAADPQDTHATRPLGERLLRGLLDLLFLPGTTISNAARIVDSDKEVIPATTHAWAPGIGVASVEGVAAGAGWAPSPGNSAYTRRIEVLKVITALCGGDLFFEPSALGAPHAANGFIECLTNSAHPLPHAATLFYSLANTALSYDPVGWGLPYNHLVSSTLPEDLVQTSMQLLNVLLAWRHSEGLPLQAGNGDEPHPNFFIESLRRIRTQDQFKFIIAGLERLLRNPIDAVQTYIPFSKHGIQAFREFFSFLWLLCLHNKEFVSAVVFGDNLQKLLVPIFYFIHEGRKSPAHAGLVHLCSLSLLALSEDREFGVSLNRPVIVRIPFTIPALPGTGVVLSDVLILIFHKIFIDGDAADALVECFLTVIANASPYLKSLSIAASAKLLNVFTRLTKPRFLAAAERNPLYVYLMLDTFNNIVQYEYDGNVSIVYTIMRCKGLFSKLANLTFEQFMTEASAAVSKPVHEVQAEQQQPQAAASSPAEKPAAASPTETAAEEPRTPQRVVTPGKFAPTAEWFEAWKSQLPITTIIRMIAVLSPQVSRVCTGTAEDDDAIIDYLKHTTLVGLLPPPHPIVTRKYSHNVATANWFVTMVWSVAYSRMVPPHLFAGANIRLFPISHRARRAQQPAASQSTTTPVEEAVTLQPQQQQQQQAEIKPAEETLSKTEQKKPAKEEPEQDKPVEQPTQN